MSSSRRIVLASHNAGKLQELQTLLAPLALELLLLPDSTAVAPQETCSTFIENALIKARAATQLTGMPAIADDSGLCVDALAGAPGVHSARFAGGHATDADNNQLLLERMRGIAPAQRRAAFFCVLVYLRGVADPAPLIASGTWHGVVLEAAHGDGGFGYDPLFFVAEAGATAAQLPPAKKNAMSHRGRAAAALSALLAVEYG